ncbi:glycoside hydrolase family 104 protein [Pantoea sp. Fr+CA_20]|uniref:glycoside hydrolase family 24 protein n=1 Tax=Pantoea TaxID=53335 RepID=UPI0021193790|nr:glycoside hydrolase family 104 protein [Pantoea sp. Fr+CA_20]
MSQSESAPLIPTIRWPIPKNNRGAEFNSLDDILTHIQGETTGHYLIGSNTMWHGGIHITDETTPWCALSGKSPQEAIDYPVLYQGEQPIRCMADGEVIAYRVNRDYRHLEWEFGKLAYSASFVLVRHNVQPGQTAASALTCYTAYIHLAPWSAYPDESDMYKVADGQHLRAYIDNSLQWIAATLPPNTRVNWNKADPSTHMNANGRQYAHVSLMEGINNKMTLKAGDMLWVVCDKGNLVPDSGPVRPAWWDKLLPPAKEIMQFDQVVCPPPYPIKAGDAVGHMGYFQAPKDGGYDKRYQVHIECMSTDKNLPTFLQNPEHLGQDNPVYVKFQNGTPLCVKNLTTKTITPDGRSTRGDAIMKLNQVRTEQDARKTEYWFLPYANGYVPKSDTSVERLSQYDLEKRGFATAVDKTPVSFDHLDGKTPPKGLVRTIYDALFQASSKDTRITHRAVPHNYRRLLNQIDSNISYYSSTEYLSAIHNPSYRDVKDRMIVKHPSEWYFSPNDPIWQTFLTSIKKDAPEWHDYSVSYLNGVRWMNQVPEMAETLWHMHPLVFLDAINFLTLPLEEARVRAFMRMLRVGEGTVGQAGYETLFGGQSFIKDYHKDFSDHPQVSITRGNLTSSAAGAYQVMGYTWNDPKMISHRAQAGIVDFTPKSQDEFCVLIFKYKRKDSLAKIISGDIDGALDILSHEWASLPPGRYGQPTKTREEALYYYNQYLDEELKGKTDLHLNIGYIEKILE